MSSLNASANIQENKQVPFFETSNVTPSSSYTGTIFPDIGYDGIKNANIKIWNPFINYGSWDGAMLASMTSKTYCNIYNPLSSQNYYIGKCLVPNIRYLQDYITDVTITQNNRNINHIIDFTSKIASDLYIKEITFGQISLNYSNVSFTTYFFTRNILDFYNIGSIAIINYNSFYNNAQVTGVEWKTQQDKKINMIINYSEDLSYSSFKNEVGSF